MHTSSDYRYGTHGPARSYFQHQPIASLVQPFLAADSPNPVKRLEAQKCYGALLVRTLLRLRALHICSDG